MKSLAHYIQEKLLINSLQEKLVIKKSNQYNYFPETRKKLKEIIKNRIKDEGNEVDLNDIDVSEITDMSNLFANLDFNGDISNWDVSNVKNMYGMFYKCTNFNIDISDWDVSNVTNMGYMFCGCESFNQDISNWNVSKVKDYYFIFRDCDIQDKYKPKFK